MSWRTHVQDTLNQGVTLVSDGPDVPKLCTAAACMVGAALWDAASSLIVAILLLFWVADMVSGVLRAIDRDGLSGFDWPKFWEGFRKLLAAGVALALAVGGDLLLAEAGITASVVFVAVGSVLSWGFFWSALQNLDHFHPGIRESVRKVLHSAHSDVQPDP